MKKKKENEQPETKDAHLPQVKKTYSLRLLMLFGSGTLAVVGLAMFIVYFFTQNMVIGAPSIFMMGGGFFIFRYFWARTEDVVTEHIGEVKKGQVNSLCIYEDKLVFEDVANPAGYPWECLDDHKKYYINIWGTAWGQGIQELVPFVLPDQQYYDPIVFAERVLALPAHRKIFMRKEKLLQKLKTVMLVAAIGIVWLLIITTTGSGGG